MVAQHLSNVRKITSRPWSPALAVGWVERTRETHRRCKGRWVSRVRSTHARPTLGPPLGIGKLFSKRHQVLAHRRASLRDLKAELLRRGWLYAVFGRTHPAANEERGK